MTINMIECYKLCILECLYLSKLDIVFNVDILFQLVLQQVTKIINNYLFTF
jgi:hypothetical protein